MGKKIGDRDGNIEGYILDNQMNWLREDLSAARERGMKHLFVFTHEPAFPTGGHTHDAMYYHGKIPEVLEMRDEFWSILSENEVVAAFFGDEHNYSRSLIGPKFNPAFPNDVWHIVSGGCGAPFYAQEKGLPWTPFVEKFDSAEHWCLIRVKGGKVELEVFGENEELVDKVRLR